jgi:hypothetical protein
MMMMRDSLEKRMLGPCETIPARCTQCVFANENGLRSDLCRRRMREDVGKAFSAQFSFSFFF